MNCDLDMDSNLLTLKFDEPVRALSFDAARVELRDAHATENKTQFVVLSSGSTSSTDAYHLQVELGERDVFAIKSRPPLGQTRNSTYCGVRSGTVLDCGAGTTEEGNRNVAGTRQAMKVLPDVTPPDLKKFDMDLDANALVLTFDEPVNVSSIDPTIRDVYLHAGPEEDDAVVTLGCSKIEPSTLTWNATVSILLCQRDFNNIFATPALCRRTDSCYMSHVFGLAADSAKPPNEARARSLDYALQASAILPDVTPPIVTSFGLDMDQGLLSFEFDEVVHLPSFDVSTITLQSARFNDFVGSRTLSADNGTECFYEDVNATYANVRLGRDDLDAIKALAGVGLALDAETTFLSQCSADEVCRIKIIKNANNTTEANTTLVCTQPACDVEKAFEIKQRSDLYVTLGAGFVRDHFGNPSEGNTGLKERDPVCDCRSGTYVQTPCTDRIDVMCAACSTACPAGQYKVSECDTHSDIGCLPCRSCQTPYFVDGGCSGSSDTICSECTPCGPLEYEVSPCTAGINRVCKSCEDNSECIEVTPVCENTPAKWWRKANCCYDNDGVQLPCNQVTEANTAHLEAQLARALGLRADRAAGRGRLRARRRVDERTLCVSIHVTTGEGESKN